MDTLTVVVIIFLIISELLPLIKNTDGNGILHLFLVLLSKACTSFPSSREIQEVEIVIANHEQHGNIKKESR